MSDKTDHAAAGQGLAAVGGGDEAADEAAAVEAWTRRRIGGLQRLHAAFSMAVLLTLGIAVLDWAMSLNLARPARPLAMCQVRILTWGNVIVSILCFLLGWAMSLRILRRSIRRAGLCCRPVAMGPEAAFERFLKCMMAPTIVWMALLAIGSSLAGGLVLSDGQSRLLAAHPAYWLNALSPVAAAGFMLATFPTRRRLAERFASACPVG